MQEQKLKKNTPRDLSTVGGCIVSIGGTYININGGIVRYQSQNRGINIEIEIDSLKEHKDFNVSFEISPEINKNLSALSKGTRDVTFCSYENRKSYLITNQQINVNLDYVDVNLMMPTIGECLTGAEIIGPPVKISSWHELGVTGREKSLPLVIRDDTFTGIINSIGEYFFDAHHRKEAGTITASPVSRFFLKIAKEQFGLQLYRKKNSYVLLTEVSIGTGIQCRMLENLNNH